MVIFPVSFALPLSKLLIIQSNFTLIFVLFTISMLQVDLVEQDKHFLEKARDYLSGIDH